MYDKILNIKSDSAYKYKQFKINNMGLYDIMDSIVAEYLEVDVETYIDIIEQCTDSESKFIILSAIAEREDKKVKAKQIFNSRLNKILQNEAK